jgi:hypothetical protein
MSLSPQTLITHILKNVHREPTRLDILPYTAYIDSEKVFEFLLAIKIAVYDNVVIAGGYKLVRITTCNLLLHSYSSAFWCCC